MDYTNFFEVIQEYLDENNLTKSALSKATGIPHQNFSFWLEHKVFPKLSSFIKIADFFNCLLDFLAGRTDKKEYMKAIENQTFEQRLYLLIQQNKKEKISVAKSCNTSIANLSKWCHGVIPRVENLIILADHFEVSLDYLVGRSDSV